ncbi:MAG: molybdopterin-dependent oxidoreductase [Gammaproteobacteria bacterium]
MSPEMSQSRREFLLRGSALSLGLMAATVPGTGLAASEIVQPFANGRRELVRYPQKRPLMRITARPPHLETPFEVFNGGAITPNDAFFVRYHLANIPREIDLRSYRLKVFGKVSKPLELSLPELKKLAEPVEIAAVNQCSGNSRGFANPRVFGSQLGNGSMGNARWAGVPLRAVLDKAGVLPGARQVTFNGLDTPVLLTTADFVKALEMDHARSPEVLLAWSMNGADIPLLNGFPLKLIVPGYFGTYWVKHLSQIEVLDHEFEGHDALFMTTAYRVPDNACWCVPAGGKPDKTVPISKLRVRSFVTNLADHGTLKAGTRAVMKGIAFDSGSGIAKVETSTDSGQQWTETSLGPDLGGYSFREWNGSFNVPARGPFTLQVRATSRAGETQPVTATWNPAGYARNVIETVSLNAA